MLKDGKRFCDVCEEKIPEGTVYRRSHLPAHAPALLTSDPELTPTWTINPNGTLSLDACTDCVLSMGNVPGRTR